MYEIKRTDKEIDEVLNKAGEVFDKGSWYPGMSYEDGIMAMFDWLTGVTDDEPFD